MDNVPDFDLVRYSRSRRAYSGGNASAGIINESARTFSPMQSPPLGQHTPYSAVQPKQQRMFQGIDFTDRTAISLAVLSSVGALLYMDAARPKWVTRKIQEHDYKEGTSGYDRYQQGGRDVILWRIIAASLVAGVGSALLLRLLVPRK